MVPELSRCCFPAPVDRTVRKDAVVLMRMKLCPAKPLMVFIRFDRECWWVAREMMEIQIENECPIDWFPA
jgi:hypothetical protein